MCHIYVQPQANKQRCQLDNKSHIALNIQILMLALSALWGTNHMEFPGQEAVGPTDMMLVQ